MTQDSRNRATTLGVVQKIVGEGGKLVETYKGFEIVREHEKAVTYQGRKVSEARDRFIIYGKHGIMEWSLRSLAGARAYIDATLDGKDGAERWDAVHAAEEQ